MATGSTDAKHPGRRAVWSTSGMVLAAGLGLVATLSLALAAMFFKERERALEDQLARQVMYARVLEDHVTRSIDTAALSLVNLATAVGEQGLGGGATNVGVLSQMLVSLPQLRSLVVLDLNGRVIGSSVPGEVGLQVDLKPLGPLPPVGRDLLGPYVSGRTLGDLVVGRERAEVHASVGFVPMLRRTPTRDGEWLVVALINPEALTTHMRLTVQEADSRAVLASFTGQVIASTGGPKPGQALPANPVFRDLLPKIEHTSYRGDGIEAGDQTVAFRVSRTRPLVVLVERPAASVLAEWHEAASGRRWLAFLGLLGALLLTWTAARSLRAREDVRRHLDLAQAKVARSERELSIIVRSVQELLFRTNAQGVLTFVNSHWAAAGGGLIDTVVGTAFADLVAPYERADVRRLLDPHSEAAVRHASITLWAAQGRPRRFDVALVPLHDGQRIVGFAGSAVDITERLQAERKLKAQLAFTGQLMNVSPLPTSVTDLEGRYVLVNQAWEEFTGRKRADVIGQPSGTHLTAAVRMLNAEQDRALLATGSPARYETKFPHRDGSLRDAVVNKLLVPDANGSPSGILSTVFDVTEFREAERATRDARDAAEEASRAKSEFIANISHELRTPLQSIMGFSELGTLRARDNEKLVSMFTDILASGRRMLALVNDLLDVSKIESSVGTILLERTDLRPLLREVLRELEPLLQAKRLTVQLNVPAAPLAAKVDPLRLQQVVRNTMANAIKFAPVGSDIVLEAGSDDDGSAHISVRDHGPGIPPKELEKIFEAFVQSSKTKDGSGGTGLGLAICRSIVAAHGGTIHAENMPDGGSRFRIQLPQNSACETLPAELAH
jgi:PAS domain S-box-containing protein